jgi:uncharacterized membrane protein YfcA
MARLALIATVAGAFSGLFGVGGGAVIVPLLILWMRYEEREATGTSLTAIPLIAALHVVDAAIVGLPAIAGVVAGAALQQRVPVRVVSGTFALLLIASALVLVF